MRLPFCDPSSGSALPLACLVCVSMSNSRGAHSYVHAASSLFANVHGITGCAGDGVHNVGGAARELSLWAGKRDNASLLDQRAGFSPGRIAGKGASCFTAFPLLWSGSDQQVPQARRRPAVVCRELVFIWILRDFDSVCGSCLRITKVVNSFLFLKD